MTPPVSSCGVSSERSVATLPGIVADGLCMGCGFCSVAIDGSRTPVELVFDDARGHFVPRVPASAGGGQLCLCPGAAMDMPGLARAVFGGEPADPVLGHYRATCAAYAADEAVRAAAASGGVVPVLLRQLFESREIELAYVAVPGPSPWTARGAVLHRADELAGISGSIYHPVNFGAALPELVAAEGSFAFVGLPCEIAALEMLKARLPQLAMRHVLSIGLFCGGVCTFAGIAYYLEAFGIAPEEVRSIEYRHGAWPGMIRLWLKSGEERLLPRIQGNTRWKILRYMIAFQGYWMLPRCRLCPDQVADFADVAVGDPHLPRFRRRRDAGASAVIVRTARGETAVRRAVAAGALVEEPLSPAELVASQGYTLDNRRHVAAYQRVGRWLGRELPSLRTYPELRRTLAVRHHVYAAVDLMKLAVPDRRWVRPFFLPWQVFEYAFITLTPSLVIRRLGRLLRGR